MTEVTEQAILSAHDTVNKLLEKLYEDQNPGFTKLDWAELQVFAFKKVEEHLGREMPFWYAVTTTMRDVLETYPLRGYEPNQIGFGRFKL